MLVLAAAAGLSGYADHPTLRGWIAVGLALLGTVPLIAVGRAPRLSLSVLLGAGAVFVLVGRLSWPVPAMIGWMVSLAACPMLLSRTEAVTALVGTELAVVCAVFFPSSSLSATPWDASVTEALAVLLAWGAGEYLRARRALAGERAAVAAQVRALKERDATARERVAMARELHDVVAHHVSMIAVRASTSPYAIPDLAPSAQKAFAEIAEQARTALAELRTVLGVLRTPEGRAESVPQPRLADISLLVERSGQAGVIASLRVRGAATPVPDSVELCGYRIVQEALTNVGRHAPASSAQVELAYLADGVEITVRDDGPVPVTSSRRRDGQAAQNGLGLVGMRERVAMLGGQFQAGYCGSGGFEVHAWLPASPAAVIERHPG